MPDDIYKQLTYLQKQLDNLVKPEIPTISELDLLYLQIVNNLSDVDDALTAFNNIKQDATETLTGVVERATQAEADTGTDTTRYISPATLANWSQRVVAENLLADTLTHEASWLAGTTFNDLADDSYAGGLWNILNDANAPDVAGVAGGSTDPFTRYLAITLDATTRVGAVQFIPTEKTRAYRGKIVSLSADLWATGITAVRMAVIVWTGTADTVTSDVVGTWGSNPTLAANWAFIGTPADITISTTPGARKTVINLTIPTNAVNLGVFIWTPNQEASTDILNIARVKLEPNPVATDFIGRGQANELREIGYFIQSIDTTSSTLNIGVGIRASTTQVISTISLLYPMRIAPTLSHNISGYTAATPGTTTIALFNFTAAGFFAITGALTVTLATASRTGYTLLFTAGTSWDGATGNMSTLRIGPSVVLLLDSRL